VPDNRYADPPQRAAELLRQALPLMTRQAASVSPIAYAVWYEHVSGRNPRLDAEIARLTADGRVLDDEATVQLYRQFVMGPDERKALAVADDLRQVAGRMAESAQEAGHKTADFDDSLNRISGRLDAGSAPDADALRELASQTHSMRATVSHLKDRLEASQREIERLQSEVDTARVEALVDTLTGLPNRRAFERKMAEAVSGAMAGPNCLLVADIDHFKRVNDTWGHLFGDQVLRVVGKALDDGIDALHTAARVGGEEFAVLLPGTPLPAALALADRLRGTIAASRIRRKDSQEAIGQVTISLGLAQWRAGEAPEAWFERADRALYASKQAGRNCTTCAED
jgi:diguanylate cyclase